MSDSCARLAVLRRSYPDSGPSDERMSLFRPSRLARAASSLVDTDPQTEWNISRRQSDFMERRILGWALRNSSGVGKGIYKSVVQSDGEFLRVGVAGRQLETF